MNFLSDLDIEKNKERKIKEIGYIKVLHFVILLL